MLKRTVSSLILVLLVTSILECAVRIQPVRATGTIYIRGDGSIDPPTAPISSSDTVTYTLTGSISGYSGIVVERNNVVIDGKGYTVQGSSDAGSNRGVDLSYRNNVTIKNTKIRGFWQAGIYLFQTSYICIYNSDIAENRYSGITGYQSNYGNISGNNVESNDYGIYLYGGHYYNRVSGNTITGNRAFGIGSDFGMGTGSLNNDIYGNNITANYGDPSVGFYGGIFLRGRSNDIIHENNIVANWCGIYLNTGSNNTIYNNNFIANTNQIRDANWDYPNIPPSSNTWDGGYPSGGNYWSHYKGVDLKGGPNQDQPGSDGIIDSPYAIYTDNIDDYPSMLPFNGYRWVWGDDDMDGVLNYLDSPSFSVSASVPSGQILGFEWSNTHSKIDPQGDVKSMLNEFYDWGVADIGTPKNVWSNVFDLEGVHGAMSWLRANAPYVIRQDFADWIDGMLCPDGHLRFLVIGHSDIDIVDVAGMLSRYDKALLTGKPEKWFDLFAYMAGMFDFQIYRLYGIDHVRTDLVFNWTIISSVLSTLSLLKSASALTEIVNQVVSILLLVTEATLLPASFPIIAQALLVKTFKFVINYLTWVGMQKENKVLDWIKCALVMADPPGEKIVLQLFDPVSHALLIGYNSTSGLDVGAFSNGIYVSDNDSALLILSRSSADYALNVTRNVPGSSIPYVLNLWDCVENSTTAVGGFLESGQVVSANLKIENGMLKMPCLQIDANFSSLTPQRYAEVLVNMSVSDALGQPIGNVNVTLCVDDQVILAQDMGGGTYQTSFKTTQMLGFYNVTIYTADPPAGFLPGIASYPLAVGESGISIINSTMLKAVVGRGFSAKAELTLKNSGDTVQPFAVSFCANTTLIFRQALSGLPNGTSLTLPLDLNTSSLSIGKYNITAYAEPIPGETVTSDNTLALGIVTVTIPGDLNGNFNVTLVDLTILANAYGSKLGDSKWNPNADIDGSGRVGLTDLTLLAIHYGQHYP